MSALHSFGIGLLRPHRQERLRCCCKADSKDELQRRISRIEELKKENDNLRRRIRSLDSNSPGTCLATLEVPVEDVGRMLNLQMRCTQGLCGYKKQKSLKFLFCLLDFFLILFFDRLVLS